MDKEAVGMEREALALGLKAMQHAMPYFQRGFETGLLERAIAAAQAALAQQPAAQAAGLTENEFQHEEFDRMAEKRYKVVPTKSGFWPYGVVAGDGERYLHIGHRKDCERVARSLAGAFCDGAFVAHGRAVLARVAPSAPVYDKSVVKRIATQMGWTPPSAQQAEPESPMKAAADALRRKTELEQAHQDGYRDGFKAAQAMLAKAEQPAEEARGVDGGLMEAIRRYAFLFALHTQNNTDASRTEADAALARVRALLAAPAAGTTGDEVQTLRAVAAEYDALIRHMDAGGDFYAFQRAALAASQKEEA